MLVSLALMRTRYVKEIVMFIIITVDKYLVRDCTQYNLFSDALYKAKEFNKSNPNAISIEILSKANGALLQKVK